MLRWRTAEGVSVRGVTTQVEPVLTMAAEAGRMMVLSTRSREGDRIVGLGLAVMGSQPPEGLGG